MLFQKFYGKQLNRAQGDLALFNAIIHGALEPGGVQEYCSTRNWGAPLARQFGLVQQMACEQYQRRLCLEDYTIDMEVGIKWTKKAMMESRRSQLQVWEFCIQNLCCNCEKKDLYIFFLSWKLNINAKTGEFKL